MIKKERTRKARALRKALGLEFVAAHRLARRPWAWKEVVERTPHLEVRWTPAETSAPFEAYVPPTLAEVYRNGQLVAREGADGWLNLC